MIVSNRAEIEALHGGRAIVGALDDIISRLTTVPFAIGTARVHSGTGTPNNRIIGSIGDVYLRTDGTTSTTVYVKESGTLTKLGWNALVVTDGGPSIYTPGTWTPALGGTGGSSGVTYSTQTGTYIKTGAEVTLWGRITLSGFTSFTTQVQLEGIPFTFEASSYGFLQVAFFSALTANVISISGVGVPGTSGVVPLYCVKAAGTAVSNLVQGDLSTTTDLIFMMSMRASA